MTTRIIKRKEFPLHPNFKQAHKTFLLGARFAVYQTKVGIITILRKYKVDVCEKTMIPYQFDPSAFLLAPKGGICLKITKI